MEIILELKKIIKRFGAVQALDEADFYIKEGEVVGVVGDNGAGKSTLMKVISGVYKPDGGKYLFKGKETHLESSHDASRLGIEMVFQDFALLDNLDIKTNIFLGREPVKNYLGGLLPRIDRKIMAKKSQEILHDTLNLEIASVHDLVSKLSGGQRQGVAIGRALLFKPSILILDEPTASLSVDKISKVLDLIHRLKVVGVSVIIISHRLQEILAVTDRIVVMYRGRSIANLITSETDMDEVVSYMVGKNVEIF